MSATEQVEAAADSDAVEWAGRAGLATRGVLYLVSAVLTVQVAWTSGATDEGPGKSGALREIAEQPFGRGLVLVMAFGLTGYAVWRFAQVLQVDAGDEPVKVWAKRAGYVARGLIYLVGTGTALSLAFSSDEDRGSATEGGESRTAVVFDLPAGRFVVLAVGTGFLIAAGYNGYRAVAGNFAEKWRSTLEGTRRAWAKVIAGAGLIGHMLVLALIGAFLVKAAWQYDPSEPEGLDEAAKAIADASYGTASLYVLAASMLAYAAFSLIEAAWRDVGD